MHYSYIDTKIKLFACNNEIRLGFVGFYWVLLGFTAFYCVLLGFSGFYWVSLGFTGFYWVLLSGPFLW